jgi:microcystin-dependent protein
MTSELLQRGGSGVASYMKGDLDMKDPGASTGSKIINLADGTAATDAVNKGQLDTLSTAITIAQTTIANAVLRDGSVAMTANLDLGGYRLNNCADPVLDTDISTKGYVDTQAALVTGTYLRLDGTNAMAGNLNMGAFAITNCGLPTASTDAVTIEYMSQQLAGLGAAPVGSVAFWPGDDTFAPSGWVFCDGHAYPTAAGGGYASLYTIIGTTFGTGSAGTFKVPDFRGRVACGTDAFGGNGSAGVISSHTNLNSVGGVDGTETHALSTAEMPAHSHTYSDSHMSNTPPGLLDGPAQATTGGGYYHAVQNNLETSTVGGGAAHNNVQPTMAMSVIIKR